MKKINKKIKIAVIVFVLVSIIYVVMGGTLLFFKWEADALFRPVKDLSYVTIAMKNTMDKLNEGSDRAYADLTKSQDPDVRSGKFVSFYSDESSLYELDGNIKTTSFIDRFFKAYDFGRHHYDSYEIISLAGHTGYNNKGENISAHIFYRNIRVYLEFDRNDFDKINVFWAEFDRQLEQAIKNKATLIKAKLVSANNIQYDSTTNLYTGYLTFENEKDRKTHDYYVCVKDQRMIEVSNVYVLPSDYYIQKTGPTGVVETSSCNRPLRFFNSINDAL